MKLRLRWRKIMKWLRGEERYKAAHVRLNLRSDRLLLQASSMLDDPFATNAQLLDMDRRVRRTTKMRQRLVRWIGTSRVRR